VLFLILGPLLRRAADALAAPVGPGAEEFAASQRRRVVSLLRRVGSMWSELEPVLQEENRILDAAAQRVELRLTRHDGAAAVAAGPAPAPGAAGLDRHRDVLARLDRCVVRLAAVGEPWADEERRRLRRALADAARVEVAMVDRAIAATRGSQP